MSSHWPTVRSRVIPLAPLAVLAALALLSCFDDATGPRMLEGRFAVTPRLASPHAAIVPIDRFRLLLRRLSNNDVALDTVVSTEPGDSIVDLSFTVPMLTSSESFLLFLQLISPGGDTVFVAGPDTVAPTAGSGQPPAVAVELDYVGVGANAAGVRFLSVAPNVFFGDTIEVVAEAFDSANAPIPGTPIAYTSLDTMGARVPEADTPLVVGGGQRGLAPIVATLLTGPADTLGVLVQPVPVRVTIDSGSGQSAPPGTALPSPIVALVKAADSLGVAGTVVRFATPSGAGTLTADSGVTNASGRASVGWTLGSVAGVYSLTAKVSGIPDSVAIAAATVAPVAAKLAFTGQPSTSVAGAILTPSVVVTALDASDNVDVTFTGPVTIALGANPGLGTLFGTLTKAATAGTAVFDDLMIDAVGSGYTLVAASGTLTQATSAAFNVTTPTPATVLWVNAAGGNWSNPANWLADPGGSPLSRVPTAGDTVLISQPGTFTVTLDVDAQVKYLFVGGGSQPSDVATLAVGSGHTLTHDSIAEFFGDVEGGGGKGVLELSGGTIASSDTIFIFGGAFNWTGGTLTGGSALLNLFGGTVRLGGGPKTLNNYELVNFTSATWSAGNITASSGSTFKNEAGATLSVTGNVTFDNGGGTPPPAFENRGTLDVQGSTFTVATAFTHDVSAVLQGTGTLDVATATSVVFDGDVNPGTSPGILTITGDLPQATGSVITLELSQPSPGVGHDQLNVSGHATLLGSIVLLPSAPAPGVYKLITFGSREPVALTAIGPLDLFGVMLDTALTATSLDVTPLSSILFAGDSISTTSSNGVFRARPTPTLVASITPEGPPSSNMTHPRWSPDRTRVTYTANPGSGPNQLHIADGKEVAHLTSTLDTSTFRPRYNSTGQRIAFQCGDNLGRDDDACTIADVSGPISSLNGIGDAGKTFVTDKVEAVYPAIKEGSAGFAWNPKNADVLAFFRDSISKSSPFDTVSHLITTRFDGSNIVVATLNGMPGASGPLIVEGEIDWSPDGSLIAFAAREQNDFTTSIWVIRPDGSNLKRVATEPFVSLVRPVFSPDGRTILFAAFVDGFEIRNVASAATDALGTTMTPLMNFPFDQAGYDWSPDGTEIVLNEDVRTFSWLVVKIKPSTTSATFTTDAILVGRGAISSEVHDQQPSWRP